MRIRRNIVVDRKASFLPKQSAMQRKHDSRLACPLCRQTSFFWPTFKKIHVDRGYSGEIADQVKSDFMIELEAGNTPNGTKGFTPNL